MFSMMQIKSRAGPPLIVVQLSMSFHECEEPSNELQEILFQNERGFNIHRVV